jgi:hypothetical protein
MAITQQTETCATAQEAAAIRRELAHLRVDIAALRWDSQRPAEDVAAVAAASLVDHADFVAVTTAQEEQEHLEAMEIQESSFQREPVDPVWSSQTAWGIEDALASLAFDPNGLHRLECRATSCTLAIADAARVTPEAKEPLPLAIRSAIVLLRLGRTASLGL